MSTPFTAADLRTSHELVRVAERLPHVYRALSPLSLRSSNTTPFSRPIVSALWFWKLAANSSSLTNTLGASDYRRQTWVWLRSIYHIPLVLTKRSLVGNPDQCRCKSETPTPAVIDPALRASQKNLPADIKSFLRYFDFQFP